MTRGWEIFVRRLLRIAGAGCLVLALALLAHAFFVPPESSYSMPPPRPDAADAGLTKKDVMPGNEKILKLPGVPMTRTRVLLPKESLKPPAPSLDSLLRVKGIMDYGKPEKNEALIETIQSGATKEYRVGEMVQGVPARITGIAEAVSFEYDGKNVKLSVKGNERADLPPTANPAGDGFMATERLGRSGP